MTEHPEVTEIHAVATELLHQARGHHSRRAARTLVTGASLRVTLVALAEGADLAEHDAPTAATLQVLTGQVRLHTHSREWTLDGGRLATIPTQRHGLHAITDSAVLLTVALS
jgi:quercetin dioxygenase-like cupin family protein